ncbi:30S ribosome-binding factor RbfA [Sandarakinorhabdus rubra]|uniref:30S ribosome-binding factor RbfA n=1 Tax=Sandarakinorhabdus rubra TaxID=2672568 RepID=UPI0013D9F22E|nr:30S ribosome-binding factor RbfA [Sandarakinorhabdus rubra]
MPRSTPDAQGRPIRLQRIGEQVRHALAEIIARGDLRDDLLAQTIISVSEVRVSPDLRHATVFVKASNGDDEAVVKALATHAKWLRGEVARRLATKYTPDLNFRRDESFDAGARIDAVLRRPEIARDLGTGKPARGWKSLADSIGDDDED